MATVNRKELSDLAGVTPQRISQYASEGMPRIGPREYDSDVCLEWIRSVRPYARRDNPDPDSGDRSMAGERLRYMTAQADGQEARNAQLMGITVHTEQVVTAVRERDARVIAEGDAWAANATTGAERRLREDLWHGLRRALHATAGSVGASLTSGDAVATTRTRHARSVGGR